MLQKPQSVDLDPVSREALQLDALLELVSRHARSLPGRDAVLDLRPMPDRGDLAAELEFVSEMMRCLDHASVLVPGGLPDPREAIGPLGVIGVALDARALHDVATVALAVADMRVALTGFDPVALPRLSTLGQRVPDFRTEARRVVGAVDSDGQLADNASPELRAIRRRLSRISETVQKKLVKLIRQPDQSAVIRDDFVTQRNGRFVVPVRTDAPRALRGIIHATSSSGATQFVEPLETIELNNERVRLVDDEREEQQRILLRWSEAFRSRIDELRDAVEILARIDALQARALFARESGGVIPELSDEPELRLVEVRHPLLDHQLQEQCERAVPLSMELDPADRVLVISGPNTGGKTVALKTIGLCVLMAQSAIPVTARRVRLSVYRRVRADIGDHQSIQANLSTFSGHIRALGEILESAGPPSLILIDEIGTGTDPAEGAALAEAILEALTIPGTTTVATTHQERLKAWAVTFDRALTAAMDFDIATLRPTYRIRMGAAGASAGLEIAGRYGLPSAVIESARARLGDETLRGRRFAERLAALTTEAEREVEALAEERRSLAVAFERRQAEVTQQAEARAVTFRAETMQELDRFRRVSAKEIAQIKDSRERTLAERARAKAERRLALDQHSQISRLAPTPESAAEASQWRSIDKVRVGATVRIHSLGRVGEVVGVRGDHAEIRLGSVVFTIEHADLRERKSSGPHDADRRPKPPRNSSGLPRRLATSRSSDSIVPDVPVELKLIGMTIDEGIESLDRFLDSTALTSHGEIRVIHGHGTGRLRRAVRRFLDRHVLVHQHRPGRPTEGGDGATIVTLR